MISVAMEFLTTIKEVMSPAVNLPSLADVYRLSMSLLGERSDTALFGSHAVNMYVDPPRATADVDFMSTGAEDFANELRDRLADQFHVAVRVRVVARGSGFRVYQIRRPPEQNRHLVDVRQVDELPTTRQVDGVRVIAPADMVLLKLVSFVARRHTDKGISDRLDLHRMLLAFPEFRSRASAVSTRLRDAPEDVQRAWREILSEPMERADDDEY
jgi:hypothetical protein